MRLAKPISVAPKKPSSPSSVMPASATHSPSSVSTRNDPGADRVHAIDLGQVDGERIGKSVDLALRSSRARDRDRARDAVERAAAVFRLFVVEIGHLAGVMRD
jgi:hypothetical protein